MCLVVILNKLCNSFHVAWRSLVIEVKISLAIRLTGYCFSGVKFSASVLLCLFLVFLELVKFSGVNSFHCVGPLTHRLFREKSGFPFLGPLGPKIPEIWSFGCFRNIESLDFAEMKAIKFCYHQASFFVWKNPILDILEFWIFWIFWIFNFGYLILDI